MNDLPSEPNDESAMINAGIVRGDAPAYDGAKRGLFARAWYGEEKLWKVFWLYGVVFGIVASVVMTVLLLPVLLASALFPIFNMSLPIVVLPYTIWILVSSWRCAWNVRIKFWGYVVRILVVLFVINEVVAVVSIVFLASSGLGGIHKTAVTSGVGSSVIPAGAAAEPNQASGVNAAPVAHKTREQCEEKIMAGVIELSPNSTREGIIAMNKAAMDDCMNPRPALVVTQLPGESQGAYMDRLAQAQRADIIQQTKQTMQAEEMEKIAGIKQFCAIAILGANTANNTDPKALLQHQAEIDQCIKEHTGAAPAQAAQVSAPVAEVPMSACEQKMTNFAVANHTDPKMYIAQNQAWLQQCIAAASGAH